MYYFDVLCNSDGIVPDTDLCWFDFVVGVETDSVVSIIPGTCN